MEGDPIWFCMLDAYVDTHYGQNDIEALEEELRTLETTFDDNYKDSVCDYINNFPELTDNYETTRKICIGLVRWFIENDIIDLELEHSSITYKEYIPQYVTAAYDKIHPKNTFESIDDKTRNIRYELSCLNDGNFDSKWQKSLTKLLKKLQSSYPEKTFAKEDVKSEFIKCLKYLMTKDLDDLDSNYY
jgi:hypothetical protein